MRHAVISDTFLCHTFKQKHENFIKFMVLRKENFNKLVYQSQHGLLVCSMDLIFTVTVITWTTKGNEEIKWANEMGGRVRLLSKQWLPPSWYEMAGDVTNALLLIPLESYWPNWQYRRKRNCQRLGSHSNIGVICLWVCHDSSQGKRKHYCCQKKLRYVNLFTVVQFYRGAV